MDFIGATYNVASELNRNSLLLLSRIYAARCEMPRLTHPRVPLSPLILKSRIVPYHEGGTPSPVVIAYRIVRTNFRLTLSTMYTRVSLRAPRNWNDAMFGFKFFVHLQKQENFKGEF